MQIIYEQKKLTPYQEKIQGKAMMYVFGRRVTKIVDVTIDKFGWRVRYEDSKEAGRYYSRLFEYSLQLDAEIDNAMMQLNWISEGNEFPS